MILGVQIAVFGFFGSVSADPLYLTSSNPGPHVGYGTNGSYTFIAPYITEVETMLTISITKVPGSANGTAKAASPTVLKARWQQATGGGAGSGQINYSVSCDLSTVLIPKRDTIKVTGASPAAFNGQTMDVVEVNASGIIVKGPDTQPGAYESGGTIADATCPPPGGDTFAVALGVSPVPKSRGYLYLLSNAFFSDSVNVSVGSDGMLSSSNTSSVQQITAIVTELAQTAAAAVGGPLLTLALPVQDPRQKCNSAIANYVKSAPYYETFIRRVISKEHPVHKKIIVAPDALLGDTTLHFKVTPLVTSEGQIRIGEASYGVVAFFPIPASVEISCTFGQKPVLLSPPTVVSLYTESQLLEPERDFLTNPQDNFTFSAGMITGHQYTRQSSAKTIVDTVTAPIRALMPAVSVQQTTQLQTGGGKPDQTTTTTQTTTGAPKSQ
jgi:hypothetical protein